MTFTKERLEELAAGYSGLNLRLATPEESMELARIALASLEEEPVGEFYEDGPLNWYQISDGDRVPTHRRIPLYRHAPPAPVSVPDERYQHLSELYHAQEKRLFKIAQRIKGPAFDKYAHSPSQAIDVLESALFNESVNERRAAMLQGAEPVTKECRLPEDFDFDRFNDLVWLEAVASNPHMHSPTTSTIAMVALELNRKLAAGNSLAIPDGWILVPIEPTQAMIDAHVEGVQSGGMQKGYRAMLAAAPQQEADNG